MDASKERVNELFLSFVSDHWRKFLFPLAAVAVVVALLFIPRGQADHETIIMSDQNSFSTLLDDSLEKVPELPSEEVTQMPAIPLDIIVDVKGAVRHPGVYTMKDGDRLIDAINAAGGYLPDANSKMINHAMKLTDEFFIYIPEEGEEMTEMPLTVVQSPLSNSTEDAKVNINTATESELMTISGIGPSKAEAIIRYREEHGLFSSIESLTEVSGIGQKTFEKLEHSITIQ